MISLSHLLLFSFFSFLFLLPAIEESWAQRGTGVASLENIVLNDPNLKVEMVFDGIRYPTSMAFLGPDDILVLEKNEGTVYRIINGEMLEDPVLDVSVSNFKERGMLGIVIDDSNKEKILVYLHYVESQEDGDDMWEENPRDPLGSRLYRYEFQDSKLINPKLLLDLPTADPGTHYGGKLALDDQQNVYLTTGDLNARRSFTQNIQSDQPIDSGAIFRVNSEGDSPGVILGNDDPVDKIYAYGIRNSFGIDFDPVTNILWDTENGPDFADEINLVEPGFNSGWRLVQGLESRPSALSDDYSRSNLVMSFEQQHGGLVGFFEGISEEEIQTGIYRDPEFVWQIPIGVTDIKFLTSDKLGEEYENDMFVGDINNGNLYHFELDGDRDELELSGPLADKVADGFEEKDDVIFGKNFGGITDLEVGPDGYLYVLSFHKSSGKIFRILPNEDVSSPKSIVNEEIEIPSWIKNNAKWWSENQISDDDFVKGLQFLIKEEIIVVPPSDQATDQVSIIPPWIKNTAAWWADGLVSDNEFVNGIQFMVNSGIIQLD